MIRRQPLLGAGLGDEKAGMNTEQARGKKEIKEEEEKSSEPTERLRWNVEKTKEKLEY